MSGPWPSSVDYVAAVQDPQQCLLDGRLQVATFATNRMGMPAVTSGQTAAVFPIELGGRRSALRLFTVPTALAGRYRQLEHHLRARPCELFVGSEWIDEAVALGAGRFPAVLMDWVPGATLSDVIDRAVEDGAPEVVGELAAKWCVACGVLEQSGIVHGDLQHGNVLVADGDLRLVDYDGCWIVGTPGGAGDAGHPNYQHPQRLEGAPVAPEGDAFSALVIAVSLTAISKEPSLWSEFHSGENLLFHQSDFVEVGRRGAPIWERLQSLGDPGVQQMSQTLAAACRVPANAVPPVTRLLREGPDALAGLPKFVAERAGSAGGATWWTDAAAPAVTASAGAFQATGTAQRGAVAPVRPTPPPWVQQGATPSPGSGLGARPERSDPARRAAVSLIVLAVVLTVITLVAVLGGH